MNTVGPAVSIDISQLSTKPITKKQCTIMVNTHCISCKNKALIKAYN